MEANPGIRITILLASHYVQTGEWQKDKRRTNAISFGN
jgi:hypothetical protein